MLPATAFALLVEGMTAVFRRPDANMNPSARYHEIRHGAGHRDLPRSRG
ncbi:MAG: hypothetical protein WDZ83_12985 [Rhizobiaceae bacterium]